MRVGYLGSVLAGLIVLLAACCAQAQCTGGRFLKGGYGVIIYGMTVNGGSEALTGALAADGNCGLTGSFSGNVGGTEMSAASVTGSYNVNANLTGSISLVMVGAPPISFAVNWVVRHRQLAGIENDGQGFAQIDAKLQQNTHYGQQSLQGDFAYLCSSSANQPVMLLSVLYDGMGGATATGSQYQGNALCSGVLVRAAMSSTSMAAIHSNSRIMPATTLCSVG
jgi:hypothetical protein